MGGIPLICLPGTLVGVHVLYMPPSSLPVGVPSRTYPACTPYGTSRTHGTRGVDDSSGRGVKEASLPVRKRPKEAKTVIIDRKGGLPRAIPGG